MGVTYVEEANPLKHNALFGISDGIYHHYVSALYTLNRNDRADFSVPGARPFVESILNESGINELLIADMATRLGVDAGTVSLDRVCFDAVERDDVQLAHAIKEFVENKRLLSEEGQERLYLFGSYYLTVAPGAVGKGVAQFLGKAIHRLDEKGDVAKDRDKGDLVVECAFTRPRFSLANADVHVAVNDFFARAATFI